FGPPSSPQGSAIHTVCRKESAAKGWGAGPSIRSTRWAAAGGWEARPDANSVQPTVHQFPSIPRQAATAPFQLRQHPVRRLRSAER
ncbi:MAG: hypothetical protein WD425_03100, partial [Nitrospirales bacterium]